MGVQTGEGYAVGNLEDMGEGPGFRKIRRELGVTAFGVNAIVLPARFGTNRHYHDEQEEVYFVHRGEIVFELGDGSEHTVGEGGVVRVDAKTPRRLRNETHEEAVYVCFGGKDGYVGRDAHAPDEDARAAPLD
jgi:uncharacterized cupin superfamily protein